MGKAFTIKADGRQLTVALEDIVSGYTPALRTKTALAALKAVRRLRDLTKRAAPVGHRGRHYRDDISVRQDKEAATATWYVAAPNYRLTHLLIRPHRTRGGGMTHGNDFLTSAVDEVATEYAADIRSAAEEVH